MKSAEAHAKRILERCGGISAAQLIRGFRLQVRERDDMVHGAMILPGRMVRGARRGRGVLFVDPALEGVERDRTVLWTLCWHLVYEREGVQPGRRRAVERRSIRRARDEHGFKVTCALSRELYAAVLRRAGVETREAA